ncbi:D-serine deaminase-like pyridoxal phosphate-dependent protein [Diaminobutyricimonas aerilata]|uniref:D-serine deaminase-like pyridoxal phosphate-dependent protein n=1 Tax=Diaminobutyricimonas aerilata TaxID=1162967 RepID=A0A2M9CHZ4_9MICO|nr:alanine racemase [Diaminobutyricimonas aerilata]PJJ71489.1 D-serine deaminase-like pyridoxal phosphate-dependent protein [Diaminobutyricimonas aerilata]
MRKGFTMGDAGSPALDLALAPAPSDATAVVRELDEATAGLDAPIGALSVPALAANARSLSERAGRLPIRVASKSVRVRAVLHAVLALPGFAGVLAYTLREALWLAETVPDVVVGYPSADRGAIARLCASESLARRVTLMIDDLDQLDLVDSVVPAGRRGDVRVCLEVDVALTHRALGRLGVWRSPIATADDARRLAEAIVRRRGFRLVGLMAYEAQLAGLGDSPAGRPVRAAVVRSVHRRSREEVADRRAAAVSAVSAVTPLEFVNGGGTGSLESTSDDPSVTEAAAGSGLFGPHLFDQYSAFTPLPAAAFALPVVRRPSPRRVVIAGGGWMASGPVGRDREPRVVLPEGLRPEPREGFGEVQTPLVGAAADAVAVGDRVWLRHAKAGELSEHLDRFALVSEGGVLGHIPTYRGEGKAFL